jgi:hypothetical protein
MIQALQVAGQLDGGLTRTNLIVALQSLDMTHPLTIEGDPVQLERKRRSVPHREVDIAKYDSARQA